MAKDKTCSKVKLLDFTLVIIENCLYDYILLLGYKAFFYVPLENDTKIIEVDVNYLFQCAYHLP